MNMLSKSQLPFMRLIIDAHIQDFVIFYVISPFKCDKVRHSALINASAERRRAILTQIAREKEAGTHASVQLD